ncbi:MAG: PH domain-containing protein [Acholeplasma sp.]|nr:PH domain-containing protein [Acholeplasma sp.]
MEKLDKKVTKNLFINRTILGLFAYVPFIVLLFVDSNSFKEPIIKTIILIVLGLLVLLSAIANFVTVFFVYKLYGYEITEDAIIVTKGVLFRSRTIVPISRIQHIGMQQGPVQLLLNLATVAIYTAGSAESIIGLDKEKAIELIKIVNKQVNVKVSEENTNGK